MKKPMGKREEDELLGNSKPKLRKNSVKMDNFDEDDLLNNNNSSVQ